MSKKDELKRKKEQYFKILKEKYNYQVSKNDIDLLNNVIELYSQIESEVIKIYVENEIDGQYNTTYSLYNDQPLESYINNEFIIILQPILDFNGIIYCFIFIYHDRIKIKFDSDDFLFGFQILEIYNIEGINYIKMAFDYLKLISKINPEEIKDNSFYFDEKIKNINKLINITLAKAHFKRKRKNINETLYDISLWLQWGALENNVYKKNYNTLPRPIFDDNWNNTEHPYIELVIDYLVKQNDYSNLKKELSLFLKGDNIFIFKEKLFPEEPDYYGDLQIQINEGLFDNITMIMDDLLNTFDSYDYNIEGTGDAEEKIITESKNKLDLKQKIILAKKIFQRT